MKKILLLAGLFGLLLTLTDCASWKQNRWLAAHRAELSRLANSKLSAEEKLDGLINDYVKFMEEDLKFINPAKTVKYVRKYHDENEASIEKILKEAENWQSSLGTIDKVSLGVRTVKKPYVNSLIDLVPKFKRKYKQYAFALKLTERIVGGLSKFAGKALGL